MSDVSAVVLSIGEPTTKRAIESLEKQTLPPEEIILVENVTPSYKAGNVGASRVKTDFLIMVGSDMILDDNCIEILRRSMHDNVGIASGFLRDPVIGRCMGIRLYRKRCWEVIQNRNTITCDTDFRGDILRLGWTTVHALNPIPKDNKELWHTFGDHQPDYTPLYTFSKFRIEGRKYSYRKYLNGMIWKISRLVQSDHPTALIALIATSHGFFMTYNSDMLVPYVEDEEFSFLADFMNSKNEFQLSIQKISDNLTSEPFMTFRYFYIMGSKLRNSHSFSFLKKCLDFINKSEEKYNWIARLGLCHGLFIDEISEGNLEKDYKIVESLLQQSNKIKESTY